MVNVHIYVYYYFYTFQASHEMFETNTITLLNFSKYMIILLKFIFIKQIFIAFKYIPQ